MKSAKSRYLYFIYQFSKTLQSAIEAHQKDPKLHPVPFLHAKDGRTPCFMLQALARIDVKTGRHNDLAEEWLSEFKALEDGIGKYDYWAAYLQQNKAWKFPAPVVKYITEQAQIAIGVLEERLIKWGWMVKHIDGSYHYSPVAVNRFKIKAEKAKWYKSEKEYIKLLKFFRDETIEIHEKLVTKELDLNKLEEGIHELRRKLRWIAIYCIALRGKVALAKPQPGDALSQYITPENQNTKFNQLPKSKTETHVLNILPGAYYAMSNVIKSIGDIKDPGLCTEEFQKIGPWFGISLAQLKKHLTHDFKTHHQVVQETRQIIETYLIKDEVLKHMSAFFNNQL